MPTIRALIQIAGGAWLRCTNPVRVIEARNAHDVAEALDTVERVARETDCYGVGFVSYEAAAAFGLAVHPAQDCAALPLVWFALFPIAEVTRVSGPTGGGSYVLGDLHATLARVEFDEVFARIKGLLAAGDSYQVDYTFRVEGRFEGAAEGLFADLAAAQNGAHSAYLDLGTHAICSASPELFFERNGTSITARPMKGTASRGRTLAEDLEHRDQLKASAKQRAENVMIVDMMRNDLGRVADVGSVAAPELFSVERYPTLWQMTSLVTARSSATLSALFAALHPSASVTGAPKVRTMDILRELEREPRGIYTGAIGYVTPEGHAHFNVAIRTAVVDRAAGRVVFGIGSGIVWDSDPADEYEECLLKASVLGRRPVQFDLLETLRWSRARGFPRLDRHLRRMAESAEYFGYAWDEPALRAALEHMVRTLPTGSSDEQRVRLLLSREGRVTVEHRPHVPTAAPLRLALALEPVDKMDPFLFHKTTNRVVYESARAGRADVDEVLLWNRERLVTEGTTTNVVVELDGELVTPPVGCGLLPGTCRAEALAAGRVREAVVSLDDLGRASRIWLLNSVHEWREAVLIETAGEAGGAGGGVS